jgi:hypothetical protein
MSRNASSVNNEGWCIATLLTSQCNRAFSFKNPIFSLSKETENHRLIQNTGYRNT